MELSTFEIIFFSIVLIVVRVIPLLFWFFIIRLIVNSFRRKKSHTYFKNNVVIEPVTKKEQYHDISKEKLETFHIDDIEVLKDFLFRLFYQFETAYNNLDYSAMKAVSTTPLFQNYYTGISLDLEVGKKKVINDIERKNVIVYEMDSTIAKQVISAIIEVSYLEYTIDKEGKVVSGSRTKRQTEKFAVVFRKDFAQKELTNCPNCGAKLTNGECEYCKTTVSKEQFKIHSIKRIIED